MQNFTTALAAEHIKKRGTGIYLWSVILGAVSPLIWIAVMFAQQGENKDAGIPYNYYIKFIENCLDPFAGFFFPLLIIITVSRITQLDHKNGGWQLMETQPIKKTSIYFSKFLVVLFSNLIAIATLVGLSYLAGYIVTFFLEVSGKATIISDDDPEFPQSNYNSTMGTGGKPLLIKMTMTSIDYVEPVEKRKTRLDHLFEAAYKWLSKTASFHRHSKPILAKLHQSHL